MKIKMKLLLLLISVLTAAFVISAGFGSWQDNLTIDASVKTADKFKDKKKKITKEDKRDSKGVTGEENSEKSSGVPKVSGAGADDTTMESTDGDITDDKSISEDDERSNTITDEGNDTNSEDLNNDTSEKSDANDNEMEKP